MIRTYSQAAQGKFSACGEDFVIGINMTETAGTTYSECNLLPLRLSHIGAVQCRTVGKILLQYKRSAVLRIDILQVEGSLITCRNFLGHFCYRRGTEGIIRYCKLMDLFDRIFTLNKTGKLLFRLIVSLICHVCEGKFGDNNAIFILCPVAFGIKDGEDHLLFISRSQDIAAIDLIFLDNSNADSKINRKFRAVFKCNAAAIRINRHSCSDFDSDVFCSSYSLIGIVLILFLIPRINDLIGILTLINCKRRNQCKLLIV